MWNPATVRALDRVIQFSVVGAVGASLTAASVTNYAYRRLIAESGTLLTDTAISTNEVSLVAVPIPAMGSNDAIHVTTLWSTAGTTTNTKILSMRLSSTACATSLGTCSLGQAILTANLNNATAVTAQIISIIRNTNTTNLQKMLNISTIGAFGVNANAIASTNLETNAGSFLNINAITSAATSDTISLVGYTVELVSGR